MDEIRILIVDDDPGMLLVMRRLIERAEGYALVGEANSGSELIDLFDQTRPDVVLMDVEMPGMNGIECGKAIQDRAPKTIIIFATAHEEYMKNAFELYAFDYLVKPFSMERALNTLALARERLGERAEAAMAAGRRAAESTAGEVLMFRGHLIRALYHACAGGHTENAENVYSSAIAYLRGVSSPGEEEYPQYSYTTEIPMAAIQEALADREDVLLLDELAPEDQLEVIERSETGRVTRIRVGLTALTGTEFRRALGLRSTNFEMEFSGKTVIFRTIGYGHGVGMSQTGADAMAARGAGYEEILAWYYTGAELKVPAGVAV